MLVSEAIFGIEAYGFGGGGQCFIVLAESLIREGEIVPRTGALSWIGAGPLLVKFGSFFLISGDDVVVVALDIKALAFAGTLAEIVSPLEIFAGELGAAHVGLYYAGTAFAVAKFGSSCTARCR